MRPLLKLTFALSLVSCSSKEEPSTANGAPTTDGVSTDATWAVDSTAHSVNTTLTDSSYAEVSAATTSTPQADNGSAANSSSSSTTVTSELAVSDGVTEDPGTSTSAATLTDDSSTPPSFPDGSPTEVALTAVPTVRQEHAVVALNDEIYVLGGFTPSATATVQAYAPATDVWRDIADFPVAFHHPNAGAIDGKLYVAGFLLGSSLSDGDGRVFAYDPNADEWTPRTSMPAGTDRGSACVTTLGAKLYVFGGASNTTVPDVSAYDTSNDTWEELSFMPELREHCVAATIGDLIYIVSGRAGSIGGVGAESFMYDPATDTYANRAPIPTPRGGTAGALLHGRVFVFGGEGNDATQTGVFSEIEAYDPASDTWHSYPSMTVPRHGFGAATLGDRIYLPGGGTEQGFGSVNDHTVFAFQP